MLIVLNLNLSDLLTVFLSPQDQRCWYMFVLGINVGLTEKREVYRGVFLGECLTKIKKERAIDCMINTTEGDVVIDRFSANILPFESKKLNSIILPVKKRNRLAALQKTLSSTHLNCEEKEALEELLVDFNDIFLLPGDVENGADVEPLSIPLKVDKPAISIRPMKTRNQER